MRGLVGIGNYTMYVLYGVFKGHAFYSNITKIECDDTPIRSFILSFLVTK